VQICSKCHTQSSDDAILCSHCSADLAEWSNTAVALKRFQANVRVEYVRVMVSADCCPACREAEGAYAKDAAPHLPVEGCSHKLGCRCFYQPFLGDLFP
jgi:hypothetical protein